RVSGTVAVVGGATGILARHAATGTRPAAHAGPGNVPRRLCAAQRGLRLGGAGDGGRRGSRRPGDTRDGSRFLFRQDDRTAAAGGGKHRARTGGAGTTPPAAAGDAGGSAPAARPAPAE